MILLRMNLLTLQLPTHCPVEPTQMRKVKMRYNLEKNTSGGQSVEPTFSQSLSDFISLFVALTLFSPQIYRISLIFPDLSRFFVVFVCCGCHPRFLNFPIFSPSESSSTKRLPGFFPTMTRFHMIPYIYYVYYIYTI